VAVTIQLHIHDGVLGYLEVNMNFQHREREHFQWRYQQNLYHDAYKTPLLLETQQLVSEGAIQFSY